jgi:hypothetical protein
MIQSMNGLHHEYAFKTAVRTQKVIQFPTEATYRAARILIRFDRADDVEHGLLWCALESDYGCGSRWRLPTHILFCVYVGSMHRR